MSYHLDDTIAAIASPPGGAPRGIVRLSGQQSVGCVEVLFEPSKADARLADLRRATAIAGVLRLPELHTPLPCDLYVWPDGRSYTRQPMVEIHTLGSPPLLECVLSHVCAAGGRLAEPGEFTLRAFLSGRLDLTQAEAVLGVIDAADRSEFDVALRQLAGGIAGPMTQLRESLLDLLAHLEAGLDFVEEDIEFISAAELESQLAAAAATVSRLAKQMTSRGQSRELVRAVLVGWPNVGKSSLFNALAGGDHALVSATAGTTRDYLTAELDLGGVRVQLVDTAGVEQRRVPSTEYGVRSTELPSPLGSVGSTAKDSLGTRHSASRAPHATLAGISAAAQQLAAEQHAGAHLRILCLDSTRPRNEWERQRLTAGADDVIVLTKSDGARAIDGDELPWAIATSAHTGEGLAILRERLREEVDVIPRGDSAVVASTATRCRESLRRAAESLGRARELTHAKAGDELVAAETRLALDELGKVVGAVYTDDVLDRIFSQFCIGK